MRKRASVIFVAIIAIAIASTSAAIGYARAGRTTAAAKPSLKIVSYSPVKVDGRHFKAHSRVKVTFTSSTRVVTYKTTDRHGAFTVVFHVTHDPCTGFVITARTRNGTTVIVHTPPKPACAPMGTM
jgi:hypothetical protein